jgi:hypothetical protein
LYVPVKSLHEPPSPQGLLLHWSPSAVVGSSVVAEVTVDIIVNPVVIGSDVVAVLTVDTVVTDTVCNIRTSSR